MMSATLPLLVVALGLPAPSAAGEVQNVLGAALETCSKPGTAMTGFTRDGHCQDEGDDDAGSHHICIEMKKDFCTVTGQDNWCEEEMPCMGQEGTCKIGNWCVCQWAFARYIKEAGGCDSIVDLVCDATNMAAAKAYKEVADEDESIKEALDCIQKRCPAVAAQRLSDASPPPIGSPTAGLAPTLSMSLLTLAIVTGLAAALARLRRGDVGPQPDPEQEAASPE